MHCHGGSYGAELQQIPYIFISLYLFYLAFGAEGQFGQQEHLYF